MEPETKRVDGRPSKFAAGSSPMTPLSPHWYSEIGYDYDGYAEPVSDVEFDFIP